MKQFFQVMFMLFTVLIALASVLGMISGSVWLIYSAFTTMDLRPMNLLIGSIGLFVVAQALLKKV